jgi:hypothetical protein
MNKLYEALENCLRQLEQGTDLETCLKRYSEQADELRPLLEAALRAHDLRIPKASSEVMRRERARLLQHAAQMREVEHGTSHSPVRSFRMAAAVLMLTLILALSGTGLVRASSSALPGDNLYPVKRTWEDVRLWFVFNPEQREAVESKYEQERLDEVDELFAEGRAVTVSFSGVVTEQTVERWLISGVSVLTDNQTQLPSEQIYVGDSVIVTGRTQPGGFVLATKIEFARPGDIPLPTQAPMLGEQPETETEGGSSSEEEAPPGVLPDTTETPEVESEKESTTAEAPSVESSDGNHKEKNDNSSASESDQNHQDQQEHQDEGDN